MSALTPNDTTILSPGNAPGTPLHGLPARGASGRMKSRASAMFKSLARPDGLGGLVLAIVLALGFACWLHSPAHLLGRSAVWLQQGGDVTQYIAGFNAFIHEPWHWPLLRITSLNYPEGTLATFVDAIPLYAALLKLLHHGPGVGFWNPYGFWIGFCYVMQGVGCWWICREAKLRSWVALASLALLLASFPALTNRLHHISLMSQWLLLFAFAIYLRGTRRQVLASGAWIALIFCAFYINIYLFSMVLVIFVADLARHLALGQAGRVLATALGISALLGASLFATMLPLTGSAGAREWGFGYYSMNLLSPFSGGNLLIWPHPVVHGGQGEGFNYLGIFLLGLFVYAWRLQRRHAPAFWSRHGMLLLGISLMALYAPSNVVYLGEVRMFEWAMPEWTYSITAQMRVSGRFFWPAGYAVVIFTVIMAQRYGKAGWIAIVLPAVVLLQLWDLQPLHARSRASVHQTFPVMLDEAKWTAFLGKETRTLYFYPPFRCGKAGANDTLLPTMLYASKYQLNMSTGYLSRVVKPCDNYAREIAAATGPDNAFVFARNEFPEMGAVMNMLGGQDAATCIPVDAVFLCKRMIKR